MTKETDILDARLRAALEKAKITATAALVRFMVDAKLDGRGLVIDSSGWAVVSLGDADRSLVNGLKRIGAIRDGQAPVKLLGFGAPLGHPAYQSLGANQAACEAAASMLNEDFGDLARFWARPVSL